MREKTSQMFQSKLRLNPVRNQKLWGSDKEGIHEWVPPSSSSTQARCNRRTAIERWRTLNLYELWSAEILNAYSTYLGLPELH